ncbi:MAG TPA: relaxase/mobilization nuclease domain-containing protein [Puia sp.]|uniref:relaxase/mobilization nuclease domain-containing protein n=1 Tax=Puia sp. TaxID=2045100 RepID=UPI002BAD1E3D|nr:relaxase/mobilization nuclease domain-containing protein [Puia sp.]HVU95496.1 relaxase/mobilization nuclease domain-containing protein [Puia sp.]
MHANLKRNPSPVAVLDYHEAKVKQKVAECIGAENFVKDHDTLSYADKLYPFELRAGYNDAVRKKMFHTSLQFGRGASVSNATMVAVAREYMEEMGRGDQPYLIYRHRDAHQEHLHLVSTSIDRDGQVIPVSKYMLRRSYAVTERLAAKYGLPHGEPEYADIPEALKHLDQGLQVLYPVINRVLEEVVPQYKYTSLEELNAVLRLHRIEASRGKAHTMTWEKQGLHYHPLGDDGKPVREYLPARRFPSRPTWASLEKRFVENQALRERHRESLTVTIDYTLAGKRLSLEALRSALAKRRVSLVTGAAKEGGERLWYVDNANKTVFEGAALGENYSFAAMQKRLAPEEADQQQQEVQRQQQQQRNRLSI